MSFVVRKINDVHQLYKVPGEVVEGMSWHSCKSYMSEMACRRKQRVAESW